MNYTTCKECSKPLNKNQKKYCSRECYLDPKRGKPWGNAFNKGFIPWNKKTPIYKQCLLCDSKFQIARSRINKAKYCSKKCYDIAQKDRIPWNKGFNQWEGKEHPRGMLGKSAPWNSKRRGMAPWNKGKICPQLSKPKLVVLRGEKAPNWKGGTTRLTLKIRKLKKYGNWRESVFERDNYKCKGCLGGKYFEAHHIVPFAKVFKDFIKLYPQARNSQEQLIEKAINYEPFWDIGNGVTLCLDCHGKMPRKKCPIINVNALIEVKGNSVEMVMSNVEALQIYSAHIPGEQVKVTVKR